MFLQRKTPERHEFILLSDVLGFSALVDMINTKGGATEGSNLGPFYLDNAPRKALGADLSDGRDGVSVLVDEMSLEFMSGSEIDFSTELIGAAFKINNPNATAGCGCGTSFSI